MTATLRIQNPDGSWSEPIPVRDVTFQLNEKPEPVEFVGSGPWTFTTRDPEGET